MNKIMGKIKKFLLSPAATLLAFAAAIGLLLFSSVGGARAALTYYSENYSSRIQLYDIGVTLLENGREIAYRNYNSNRESWNEKRGVLLEHMLEADGKTEVLKPGKTYQEDLCVRNSGTINQYVRVNIYKYWKKDGVKQPEMSPGLIKLNLVNTGAGGWIEDTEAATKERTVLYYNKPLKAMDDGTGEVSPPFADALAIDGEITARVTQDVTEEVKDGVTYRTVTTTYDYDGAEFCVEVSVDAVQEHNAEDAIWSAWGRRATIKDGVLSLD